MYISTGLHRFRVVPIHGEALVRLVEQSKVTDGADGIKPRADRLYAMIPSILEPLVRDAALEDAIVDPGVSPTGSAGGMQNSCGS